MRNYVLGFMIDEINNKILLIKKNRPAFQAGKLNGIGGKIEENELPIEALVREVSEETGLQTKDYEWRFFGRMNLPDGGCVHLFSSLRNDLEKAQSMTDEEVLIKDLKFDELKGLVMPNLIWLIDSSLDESLKEINIDLY